MWASGVGFYLRNIKGAKLTVHAFKYKFEVGVRKPHLSLCHRRRICSPATASHHCQTEITECSELLKPLYLWFRNQIFKLWILTKSKRKNFDHWHPFSRFVFQTLSPSYSLILRLERFWEEAPQLVMEMHCQLSRQSQGAFHFPKAGDENLNSWLGTSFRYIIHANLGEDLWIYNTDHSHMVEKFHQEHYS